jgi:glycerol-3-phosphate acyltransferase PlsY
MRIGGKKAALITLAGDMLKGVPLVLLAQHLELTPDLLVRLVWPLLWGIYTQFILSLKAAKALPPR